MEPESENRRRASVLADATRQFCAIVRPAVADIEAYKELFYELIAYCDTAARRQLSASLAACSYTPRAAAIFLASDEIAVATPILLYSPALNEAHVARLAARLPLSHLLVLCRRGDLSEESMRAFLDAGGEQCRKQLENNPLARAVCAAIAGDRQAPPDPLSVQTPEATMNVRPMSLDQRLLELAARGGRFARKEAVSARPIDQEIPFERKVVLAARAKGGTALFRLIADRSGCSAALVARLAKHEGASALAVLLKGLGLDGVTAMQTLLLACPEAGADRVRFRGLSAMYARLDPAESREFIAMLAGLSRDAQTTAADWPAADYATAAQGRRAAIAKTPRETAPPRARNATEPRRARISA